MPLIDERVKNNSVSVLTVQPPHSLNWKNYSNGLIHYKATRCQRSFLPKKPKFMSSTVMWWTLPWKFFFIQLHVIHGKQEIVCVILSNNLSRWEKCRNVNMNWNGGSRSLVVCKPIAQSQRRHFSTLRLWK